MASKDFLTSKDAFVPLLVGSQVWNEAGWSTILYFAALTGINPELFEAAKLDGAGPLARIRVISLPTMLPVITFSLIMALEEFYTRTGRLAQQTQTALAIVLWLNLIPEGARQRQVDALMANLKEENMHLTTGFVGTPLLCPVLTENGHPEAAYTLLLNEDYPSWLYEVNMGATTVWERWNSVLPDGSISDTGMNSLNHYAYGSIVEWMVRYMCGLNAAKPGYRRFALRPYPDGRLDWVRLFYDSAYGVIRSEWKKDGGGMLYTVQVPFDTEAEFILPAGSKAIRINGQPYTPAEEGAPIHLTPGLFQIYAE